MSRMHTISPGQDDRDSRVNEYAAETASEKKHFSVCPLAGFFSENYDFLSANRIMKLIHDKIHDIIAKFIPETRRNGARTP